MLESYKIILEKLQKDKKNLDSDIAEVVDDVETYEWKKSRYNRLLGRKQYCEDLIVFFQELIDNIK